MSLVAYASSGDESDESDEAPVTADVITNKDTRATPDEEILHEQEGSSATSVSAAGQISDSDSEEERRTDNDVTNNNTQEPDIGSLLKGLPEPKAYDEASASDKTQKAEEDLEEEVKPKLSQIKDAPKPPPKRAKVRITIPALKDVFDEEEQVKKKPKLTSSNVKSGLTGLLPAPVHAATKQSNRLLLPYTLKKPQEKKKPKPSTPGHVTSNAPLTFPGVPGYGSDSDSDEADSESTNFFSLGDSEPLAAGPVLPDPLPMQKSAKLSLPPPKLSQIADDGDTIESKSASVSTVSEVTLGEDLSDTEQRSTASTVEPSSSSSDQDAPLSFKSGNWNTMSAPYHVQYGGYESNSDPSSAATMAGPQMDYLQYEAGPQYSQNYEKDDEFLRMQGKKQRGKEEINIVDVNADDFISNVDMQKSMSEETKEYAAHRKKDGPTSQQKRKHQITYLAHQAKETELELKNQWSMNRMTKRQTQAKYGF